MIPHSRPCLGDQEIEAAVRVVRSGILSSGPETVHLESKLSRLLSREVACVSSGTAALHMGLIQAGLCKGSKVAIPTHCCPSVLYALRYIGATPVLYDCSESGAASDPVSLNTACEQADAVVVVHQFGLPDPAVLNVFPIPLIEDCAAAIGCRLGNHPAGSFGDIAVFSFYATKLIAGGECGAAAGTTEAVRWIREHRTPRGADDGETHYAYSPSEISSAVANAQLDKLEQFIERRTGLAERYSQQLEPYCRIPRPPECSRPVWHRYVIGTGERREDLIKAAVLNGIQVGYGVKTPIHRLLNLDPMRFPNSERASQFSVSLPIYPDLTLDEQDRIIGFVREFL